MATYALPIAFTLALWWASTVAILYLDGLHPRTFIWSMSGASLLLAGAIVTLVVTSSDTGVASAYWSFACGLVAWGWQLVSFYMGYITGPQKAACEPGCVGLARFVAALRTSLHHELAAVAMAILLVALTWNEPNKIGAWTFLVLLWMHQSAKLNLFFGVPNHGAELLPDHLKYLASFMSRRPMNLFFPFSVTVSTLITVWLAQLAAADGSTPFEAAAYAMLATLMALAVLEHWFLVAPLDINGLWLARAKTAAQETKLSEKPGLVSLGMQDRISFEACRPQGTPGNGGRKWVG